MAENNSSAPLKTAELPLAVRTAPERIWLDLGVEEAEHINFAELEVTWSDDNATGHGIAYVRADAQAVAAQAAPAAPDTNRLRAEILEHASKGSRLVRTLFNEPTGTLSDVEVGDWIQRAQQYLRFATPALPATEDSSAGDLATESVLIEGVAYTIPEPVALELLRLNIELQLAEAQTEPVALQMCSDLKPRTESEKAAYLAGVADGRRYAERDANTAPQAETADALDAWQAIGSMPTCDDLIWLYCQDTNTIDGPVAPHPIYEDSWTHWAYAQAPSTATIDAAMAAAQEGGKA